MVRFRQVVNAVRKNKAAAALGFGYVAFYSGMLMDQTKRYRAGGKDSAKERAMQEELENHAMRW